MKITREFLVYNFFYWLTRKAVNKNKGGIPYNGQTKFQQSKFFSTLSKGRIWADYIIEKNLDHYNLEHASNLAEFKENFTELFDMFWRVERAFLVRS